MIKSDSENYFFDNFGGLHKAIVNSEMTTLEETNSGAFWIGTLNIEEPFLGPPNYNGGRMDWNEDFVELKVYRKITSGSLSHVKYICFYVFYFSLS